jgi:hypothetical protein
MGSVLFTGFAKQAFDGNISGAGPDDPEKRDMLRAQGWQPYSIKIGDHWVSYANWGPMAMPLAQAAATAESVNYRKPGAGVPEMLADGARRTAQLVTEQTYLQGIGSIWKALDDPSRYGSQFLGQLATSSVPFGAALNTVATGLDPTQRAPQRDNIGTLLTQSLEARLPGLSQNVPAAQDQLGRPVPNPAGGLGTLDPLRVTEQQPNVALQELLKYGADVGNPPTSVRNVPLTPAEQRTVNEKAGPYIERNVAGVIASPDYQQADAQGKQRALSRAVQNARGQAGSELLQSLSETEINRRLAEQRTKREPVPMGLGG